MSVPISGPCPPRFEAVRAAFEANFTEADEHGAGFSLVIDGEVVVDLVGGFADRAGSRPVTASTLFPIYSSTKAVAALMMARLVEQGRLDYERPVADYWPEYGQAGKAAITVGQMLSHQDGLPGFPDPIDPHLWLDWDAVCAALAAMAPMWPPGTASGYHPTTFGYLAGELYWRVTGTTMAEDLRDEIAVPAGLDLFIGLPDAEAHRLADMLRPKSLPDFGELNAYARAAFMNRWSTPPETPEWRKVPLPSSNGFANASSLARLMGGLAADGELDNIHLLAPQVREQASRLRIRGQDLVLPFEIEWGAGFMRSPPNFFYGPSLDGFGHSGRGGSCVLADPEHRVGCAYVMNRQSPHLLGDPRARRLIAAAYEGLGR
ncbi:MAG: beta-lactamase [Caulobacteraceae bacterium]|nr:beta-lactamase [Caulobacteraceae bacterium]